MENVPKAQGDIFKLLISSKTENVEVCCEPNQKQQILTAEN